MLVRQYGVRVGRVCSCYSLCPCVFVCSCARVLVLLPVPVCVRVLVCSCARVFVLLPVPVCACVFPYGPCVLVCLCIYMTNNRILLHTHCTRTPAHLHTTHTRTRTHSQWRRLSDLYPGAPLFCESTTAADVHSLETTIDPSTVLDDMWLLGPYKEGGG